jgi:hypothetical protein
MFRSNFLYIIIIYNEKIKTKKVNQEENETEKILLILISSRYYFGGRINGKF